MGMHNREGYINGLREFADFLEANPEFDSDWIPTTINVYTYDEDELKKLVKTLPGKRDKKFSEYGFTATKHFDGLKVEIYTPRDTVCTKKKVGTKIVTKEVPVSDETKTVTEEQDVYEYDCTVIID